MWQKMCETALKSSKLSKGKGGIEGSEAKHFWYSIGIGDKTNITSDLPTPKEPELKWRDILIANLSVH